MWFCKRNKFYSLNTLDKFIKFVKIILERYKTLMTCKVLETQPSAFTGKISPRKTIRTTIGTSQPCINLLGIYLQIYACKP